MYILHENIILIQFTLKLICYTCVCAYIKNIFLCHDPFWQSDKAYTALLRMSLNVENEMLRTAMETNFNKI